MISALFLSMLAVLNIIDYKLTKEILDSGGREYNPVMRFFINRFGYKGMAGLKLVVFIGLSSGVVTGNVDAYTLFILVAYFSYVAVLMYRDCLRLRKGKGSESNEVSSDQSISRTP